MRSGSSRTVPTTLPRPALAPLALPALLLAAAPGLAVGQDAAQVLRTALERYEERVEGIQSYTLTQTVMGFQTTRRYERETLDGHPYFRLADESGDPADESLRNPYALFPKLEDRATLRGREPVGEYLSHVVVVDDFSGLDVEELGFTDASGDFEPRSAAFYLGTVNYLLRKIEVDGVVRNDGKRSPVSMTAVLRDYREVKGMRLPFFVEVRVRGLGDALSEEDRKELESFQLGLEEMPEERRKAMEQMMGPQVERVRRLLESGDLDFEVRVSDVQVNRAGSG